MSSGFTPILIDRINKTYQRAKHKRRVHNKAARFYAYARSGLTVPVTACTAAAAVVTLFNPVIAAILAGVATAFSGLLAALPISATRQQHLDAAIQCGTVASFLEREMNINFNKSSMFIPIHADASAPVNAESEQPIHTEEEYITYLLNHLDDFDRQDENAPVAPWFIRVREEPNPIQLITVESKSK